MKGSGFLPLMKSQHKEEEVAVKSAELAKEIKEDKKTSPMQAPSFCIKFISNTDTTIMVSFYETIKSYSRCSKNNVPFLEI